MIFLYSGTPGSGKSLHVAERLYHLLRAGRPTVCNFPINLNRIPKKKRDLFCYKSNLEITPEFLIEFSQKHFQGKKVKEGSLLLVIDECQLMFNAGIGASPDAISGCHFLRCIDIMVMTSYWLRSLTG